MMMTAIKPDHEADGVFFFCNSTSGHLLFFNPHPEIAAIIAFAKGLSAAPDEFWVNVVRGWFV